MTYAVVIGIDDYHEKPLKGAVADARKFAEWLDESGQTSDNPGQRGHRLKLITSQDYPERKEPPTQAEINMAVKEVFDEVRKLPGRRAKRFYFYFAGHGLGLTYTNTALCMRPWSSFLDNLCISTRKYLDGFLALDMFDEVILFLDCCRDADLLVEGEGPGWRSRTTAIGNSQYIVGSSTRFGKRSQEIEITDDNDGLSKRRGAFTKFLLDALNGDAARPDTGEIFASDLFKHMNANFPAFTSTLRYVQECEFSSNLGAGDLLIHKVAPRNDYNFIITFTKARSVSLVDPTLHPFRSGTVRENEAWTLKLERGMYTLTDDNSGEEMILRNYNEKTLSHERF